MKTIIKTLTLILLVLGFQMVPVKATMSPIEISTPEQFMGMLDPDASYILTGDLDFSDVDQFTPPFPSDTFNGVFDGNGHTISNISVTYNLQSTDYVGLFRQLYGATIKNIVLKDMSFNIEGANDSASLIGVLAGTSFDSRFNNIEIINSQIVTSEGLPYVVGGLIGFGAESSNISSGIEDIKIDFNYKGDSEYVGGLMGMFMPFESTLSHIDLKLSFEGGQKQAGLFGVMFDGTENSCTLGLVNIGVRGVFNHGISSAALFGELNFPTPSDLTITMTDIATKLEITNPTLSDNNIYSDFASMGEGLLPLVLTRILSNNSISSPLSDANAIAFSVDASSLGNYALDGQELLSSTSPTLLSAGAAANSASYPGFDFVNTWVIHPKFNQGIPYLRYNLGYIAFITNGGSLQIAQPFFKGEPIPMPDTPSYEGHTFEGWYTNSDLTTRFDHASPLYESQTLYAKWISNVSNTENPPTETVVTTIPISDRLPDMGVDEFPGLVCIVVGTCFYLKSIR